MQKTMKALYHGHRFPAVVISQAVRWYFRFQLSLRDIEELLLARGVVVSYETIRRWYGKFGASFAHRVKAVVRRRRKPAANLALELMRDPSCLLVTTQRTRSPFMRLGLQFMVWQVLGFHRRIIVPHPNELDRRVVGHQIWSHILEAAKCRMITFASSLKKEIARVARKELRDEISSLRKGSATNRSEITELKRKLKSLESQVKALGRATPQAEPTRKTPSLTEAPRGKPGRKVVFGAAEFLALRQHLGFTQAQMGKLLNASSLSIYKWESGQVTPRAAQLEKILAVRKIGKREALARIQA